MKNETLTITDNRTNISYEIPVANDTINALDLRQIKVNKDDFGMMSFDPGYTNTASC
ncbi:MAG: citrate (Si)-synthase, partial [Dehalococcoidia bacterium]|nr:citrate (Si)-synthase [Dehalococcoidia bacterium]